MKLLAFFISICAFSSLALGADDAKTLKVLKNIEQSAGESVANGSVSLSTYDVKTFNIGKELARIRQDFTSNTWNQCEFDFVVGRTENLAAMQHHKLNEETKVDAQLAALHKGGKLKTILSAQWNGLTGDGEACSVYYFEIYTVGGSVLMLDYELTD